MQTNGASDFEGLNPSELCTVPGLTGAYTIVTKLRERGEVFTASAALVERFGLFTIIVLAESILGTITGIAEVNHEKLTVWIALMLCILISFLLWSLYFDMTSEQETKKGYQYLQGLLFLHFPLLGALSIAGACIKLLLTGMESGSLSPACSMFCVALAVILFSIVGLTKIMEEAEEDRAYIQPVSRLLIVIGICLLAVPLFADTLGALGLLSAVAFLLFIPVFVGVSRWIRYKFPEEGLPG